MTPAVVFMILILFNFTTGCYYYKVHTYYKKSSGNQYSSSVSSDEISSFDTGHQYIILHEADTAWHLSEILSGNDKFSGLITPLPEVHYKFKTVNREKSNRYFKEGKYDETVVLHEVHIYVSALESRTDSTVVASLTSIERIEFNQFDKSRTAFSWALPFIVIFGIAPIVFWTGGLIAYSRAW
jgi:hypothetical protein